MIQLLPSWIADTMVTCVYLSAKDFINMVERVIRTKRALDIHTDEATPQKASKTDLLNNKICAMLEKICLGEDEKESSAMQQTLDKLEKQRKIVEGLQQERSS